MTELVRYDAMCRAINAAYEVDEVKDIRDKALAIEVYTRQAHNVEAERRASDIRLRAERKVGQLLGEMDKAKAGQPPKNPSADTRDFDQPKTLADLGISYDQSSKWQQLAEVPDEQFEAALAAPDKPTTTGIIEAAKQAPVVKPTAEASSPMVTAPDAGAIATGESLQRYLRNARKSVPPFPSKKVIAALTSQQHKDLRRRADKVRAWTEKFISLLDAAAAEAGEAH